MVSWAETLSEISKNMFFARTAQRWQLAPATW